MYPEVDTIPSTVISYEFTEVEQQNISKTVNADPKTQFATAEPNWQLPIPVKGGIVQTLLG